MNTVGEGVKALGEIEGGEIAGGEIEGGEIAGGEIEGGEIAGGRGGVKDSYFFSLFILL